MTVLTVGPNQTYTTIEAAVAQASSGDTIDVQSGTYTNDFIGISKSLTLTAVGGTVDLVATTSPPNGKAIIDEGGPGVAVSISGFDISGSSVADGNGAAIRYEGGSLSLTNDTIHGNQEGLLSNADSQGSITIDHSTFYNNGDGSGYTHDIYVGDIASLVVQNSTIAAANVGHEIKSRAASTTITGNTIEDGPNGTSSYEIDTPNGGNVTITGNMIEKGPHASNPNGISYGEEGNLYANGSLDIENNTIVNDSSGSTTTVVNDGTNPATFSGNQLYGWQTYVSGPSNNGSNTTLSSEPTFQQDVPCFCSGTLIATPEGEVPVEQLVAGDRVLLASGGVETVRWVGRRSYGGRFVRARPSLTPVVIGAGALGDGLPRRVLRVSPLHAMLLDGVLIPAGCLVNGSTITQPHSSDAVHYVHVELRRHDVILAEGAPSETFLDDNSRGLFHNAAEFVPGDEPVAAGYCAPRLDGGYEVEAVRRRLGAVAEAA